MQHKVLILTTTESGNRFPENFSCWCAGALAAKGCSTKLEIIRLKKLTESLPRKSLRIQKEELKSLQNTLSTIEKLVLILPELNNMLPADLDSFIPLLSVKKKYKTCKLVAIVMDSSIHKYDNVQNQLRFNYPIHKLDAFFGSTFSANRMQIQNSPTGDMCNLFANFYSNLRTLIQQILH